MYTPLRMVTSSLISRNKCDSNSQENKTDKEQNVNENRDFLKNLDYQMQSKIKNDVYNKLKMNNKFLNKKRNFDSKFDNVKKRFETETRIYQTSLSNNLNNREEKFKVQMSSADKYLSTIHTIKDAGSSIINKHSLHNRNWVLGQIATKIEDNDDNLNDSVKNKLSEANSIENKEQIYQFSRMVPEAKKVKYKKRTFVDEFISFKDKYEAIMKTKKRIKHDDYLSSSSIKESEINKSTSKIITPFRCFKTSFFNDVNNPAETMKSKVGSCRKEDRFKNDITSDWVKGEVIKRKGNITNNFDETVPMRQIPESKHVALNYLRLSSNKRALGDKRLETLFDSREEILINPTSTTTLDEEEGNSTMTISNSVHYSSEIVFKKTQKIIFPSHLFY